MALRQSRRRRTLFFLVLGEVHDHGWCPRPLLQPRRVLWRGDMCLVFRRLLQPGRHLNRRRWHWWCASSANGASQENRAAMSNGGRNIELEGGG
jgi:hypothetical protein